MTASAGKTFLFMKLREGEGGRGGWVGGGGDCMYFGGHVTEEQSVMSCSESDHLEI